MLRDLLVMYLALKLKDAIATSKNIPVTAKLLPGSFVVFDVFWSVILMRVCPIFGYPNSCLCACCCSRKNTGLSQY